MWRSLKVAVVLVVLMLGMTETVFVAPKKPLTVGQEKVMLDRWIAQRAKHYGFSPRMVRRMIQLESRWNAGAVSKRKAYGLMQVKLPTAREVLKCKVEKDDLLYPYTNVEVGLKYLRNLVRYYGGDVPLALTAYNRGLGNVDKALCRGENPSNGYADSIMEV